MKECIHYHYGIEKEERFRVYWRLLIAKGRETGEALHVSPAEKKKDKEEDKKKAKQQKKRGERKFSINP